MKFDKRQVIRRDSNERRIRIFENHIAAKIRTNRKEDQLSLGFSDWLMRLSRIKI